MKAWHVLLIVAIGVAAFFGWRMTKARAAGRDDTGRPTGPPVGNAFPKPTTIPQTPVAIPRPVAPVSVVAKAPPKASILSGAVRSVASHAIANSGIPGAGLLAKPGGAVAVKAVSLASKLKFW